MDRLRRKPPIFDPSSRFLFSPVLNEAHIESSTKQGAPIPWNPDTLLLAYDLYFRSVAGDENIPRISIHRTIFLERGT
jgi:hypothetical protein